MLVVCVEICTVVGPWSATKELNEKIPRVTQSGVAMSAPALT